MKKILYIFILLFIASFAYGGDDQRQVAGVYQLTHGDYLVNSNNANTAFVRHHYNVDNTKVMYYEVEDGIDGCAILDPTCDGCPAEQPWGHCAGGRGFVWADIATAKAANGGLGSGAGSRATYEAIFTPVPGVYPNGDMGATQRYCDQLSVHWSNNPAEPNIVYQMCKDGRLRKIDVTVEDNPTNYPNGITLDTRIAYSNYIVQTEHKGSRAIGYFEGTNTVMYVKTYPNDKDEISGWTSIDYDEASISSGDPQNEGIDTSNDKEHDDTLFVCWPHDKCWDLREYWYSLPRSIMCWKKHGHGAMNLTRDFTIGSSASGKNVINDMSITTTAELPAGCSDVSECNTLYPKVNGDRPDEWTDCRNEIWRAATCCEELTTNINLLVQPEILSTGEIISVADAGSGRVRVESTAHGLHMEESVTITDSASYDGTYLIYEVIDANNFDITATFSGTDTGNWAENNLFNYHQATHYSWNFSDDWLICDTGKSWSGPVGGLPNHPNIKDHSIFQIEFDGSDKNAIVFEATKLITFRTVGRWNDGTTTAHGSAKPSEQVLNFQYRPLPMGSDDGAYILVVASAAGNDGIGAYSFEDYSLYYNETESGAYSSIEAGSQGQIKITDDNHGLDEGDAIKLSSDEGTSYDTASENKVSYVIDSVTTNTFNVTPKNPKNFRGTGEGTWEGEGYTGSTLPNGIDNDDANPYNNWALSSFWLIELEMAGNNSPVAINDTAGMEENGGTIVIDVAENDTDADGTLDLTSVTIISDVSNGSTVNNLDGTVDYTPTADWFGSDSFTYTIDDNVGATSNTATVSITVNETGTPVVQSVGSFNIRGNFR